MKKAINYLIQNIALVSLAILGLIYGIQGAYNLFAFLVITGSVIMVLLVVAFMKVPDFTEKIAKEPKVVRPAWYFIGNMIIDIPLIIFLIWHGKWFTGAALMITLFSVELFWSGVKGVREVMANDDENISKIIDVALVAAREHGEGK